MMANNDPLGAGHVSCVRVGLMSWLAPVCLGCEPGPESSAPITGPSLYGGLARGTNIKPSEAHNNNDPHRQLIVFVRLVGDYQLSIDCNYLTSSGDGRTNTVWRSFEISRFSVISDLLTIGGPILCNVSHYHLP